jgi:hypothetical protein
MLPRALSPLRAGVSRIALDETGALEFLLGVCGHREVREPGDGLPPLLPSPIPTGKLTRAEIGKPIGSVHLILTAVGTATIMYVLA